MITRRQTRNLAQNTNENLMVASPGCDLVNEKMSDSPPQFSEEPIEFADKLPLDSKSWHEVKCKLESLAWIQCDNQNCKKWRKVQQEDLADFNESEEWFCHQNCDTKFNSCDISEEDTKFYDSLADRCGLKYLQSQLDTGALVWARMKGFCSWPAVVTPEPETRNGHVYRNEDDEIAQYHVEFLGKPHCHGWVAAKDVTSFTAASVSKHHPTSEQKNRSRGTPGRKKRNRKRLGTRAPPKMKTMYKTGVTIEHGIAEAMELLNQSPQKRLDECIYVTREHMSAEIQLPNRLKENLKETVSEQNCGEGKMHMAEDRQESLAHLFLTPCSCSLLYRTNIERLLLDIEMYKQSENTFEHDLMEFKSRNGERMFSKPFWENRMISLFQLFLAVREKGGYEQVTQRKRWAAVYRDVTEPLCFDVADSIAAKTYYLRHLYPYELYVHGIGQNLRDHSLQNEQRKSGISKCSTTENRNGKIQNNKWVSTDLQQLKAGAVKESNTKGEDGCSSESMKKMFQFLDENGRIEFDEMEQEAEVDEMHYEDSTPTNDRLLWPTAIDPKESSLPAESKMAKVGCREKYRTPTDCQKNLQNLLHMNAQDGSFSPMNFDQSTQFVPLEKNSSDSVVSHELLNELEELQEGMDFIDGQIV